MKLTKSKLKQLIKEELQLLLEAKPYRGISRRGRTESQAQQKAAGMAWGCRKKRGEDRKECAKKLKSYGGAAWNLYDGEITNAELKRLATIRGGAEIPEKDAKPGDKLKNLPKKINEAQRSDSKYLKAEMDELAADITKVIPKYLYVVEVAPDANTGWHVRIRSNSVLPPEESGV